ncbi:DUF4442 domain-containing protein [Aquimarina sp. U1-2]|uniref:DUF4442 domain-containing protein n=1 Tax=Aquimarina sp. U1-2 TaxID=2823141 RepID=UPI001AEC8247|nr:DUF4442 domain-containing protein [Aquimarina sp. U1-2]MBP2833418.1 DUF4442 domain-containing protein [Aquimarina sp. U1-2]
MTPGKLNTFLLVKLPSAWLCGVRVKSIDQTSCTVTVKHKWINQNPFNSMFWAVQGMAAELTTGALVTKYIRDSGKRISMLVATNNATFTKKATGRITFVCNDGQLVKDAIKKTIKTGEGQTVWMTAVGTNSDNVEVSTFNFEWTLKVKNK